MLSTCLKTISCLALWGQRFAFITQNVHTAYLYWVLIKITCFITSSYHNYYFVLYILGILAEFNYYSMQSCIKAGLVIFGLFFSLISFWKRWTNPSFGYRYTTFVDSIFNVCSAQHNTNCRIRLANHILFTKKEEHDCNRTTADVF